VARTRLEKGSIATRHPHMIVDHPQCLLRSRPYTSASFGAEIKDWAHTRKPIVHNNHLHSALLTRFMRLSKAFPAITY
jgi:hypothetical protein